MSQDAPRSSLIDVLTKVVTLVSLALAAFAAWKALPVDAEIKELNRRQQALDLALKQAEADLKAAEASRKLTFELYQEVRNVIGKRDKDAREEEAVRALVETLAEDPLRWKLLSVIAVAASNAEVKDKAAAASTYFQEEAAARAQPAQAAPPPSAPRTASRLGGFNVDVFFCEARRAGSEPLARAAVALKPAGSTGRWRLRALPETINQQPGYQIRGNELRYTPPDERAAAEELAALLAGQGIRVSLRDTAYPTPGYVSVFVCQ